MTSETISVERVMELIEAFGAEPGGWPAAERDAAARLIERRPDLFETVLSDARALDQMLMGEVLPEPSADLATAVLAGAPNPEPTRHSLLGAISSVLFPRGVRWPAGAALASLVMGLVGGYAYASGEVSYDQADAVYYAAFGVDSDETWLGLE